MATDPTTRIDLTASGKLGGGFSSPNWGHWSSDQPGFWSLVLFAVILVGLFTIFKSLR